ncbi:MAG: extracellular solute-binding protein [Lachnospirales bacterium]
MKKLIKTTTSILLALTIVSCGGPTESAEKSTETTETSNSNNSSTLNPSELDPVELNLYFVGDGKPGYEDMLEVFNEKISKDINATIKVNWIGWSDFSNQYPLVLASGEPIDLIYTSNWLGFYQQASKGAFLPLEDLLPTYAPESLKQTSESSIIQATVNGHMYALPAERIAISSMGSIVRGDLMDKYNIEPLVGFEGLEKYLQAVSDNEPSLIPTDLNSSENLYDDMYFTQHGNYGISGSTDSSYYIDLNSKEPQVTSVADTKGVEDMIKIFKKWYEEGFWQASVLSNQDTEMFENGMAASKLHNMDRWVSAYMKYPEWDVKYYDMTNMINYNAALQDAMAIPVTAENPERALMLLERLRTDRDTYDIFTYGIPNEQSIIHEDGTVEAVDDTNFSLDPTSWAIHTEEFYRYKTGLPQEYFDLLDSLMNQRVDNIYKAFYMDLEPIKNEYAAVQNVIAQYYEPLILGYVDPESGLKELREQLKIAGNDQVIAELQKQLDVFEAKYK